MPTLIRKTFPVPPLSCNCTILGDPITKQALLVDPGGDADRILREVNELGWTISMILHTHAHFDHFLASGTIREATNAPICLHHDDLKLWDENALDFNPETCTRVGRFRFIMTFIHFLTSENLETRQLISHLQKQL